MDCAVPDTWHFSSAAWSTIQLHGVYRTQCGDSAARHWHAFNRILSVLSEGCHCGPEQQSEQRLHTWVLLRRAHARLWPPIVTESWRRNLKQLRHWVPE
jgi:hypothetical protein